MTQLSAGTHAPNFELKDYKGQSHLLSEALARGPVVLAFYKASCPTSQFTFPYLQRIVDKVGGTAGWTLWGISEDDVEETREFAERGKLTFDLLIDEYPYAVSAAYGLGFVPAIFIIRPEGTIALSDFGFSKDALNAVAGFEFLTPNDGLPARRPG